MKRNILIMSKTFFLLLFLLSPSFLGAQPQEYKDYTVIKGDTLWDISHKELKDPFLWPKIWKENPDIGNPDKIYPGQKIKIPLHILQKEIPETTVEIKPEIKKEEPQKEMVRKIEPRKKEYLVDKNLLISSGYITDSVRSVGVITDSPDGKTLLGKNDYAYIKTDKPVKRGDRFHIIRSVEKVKHPKFGNSLGYLIEILGIAQVVDNNNDPKVLITDSYDGIFTGDLIDNFYEIEPPLAIETPRKPNVNGFIVATRQLHTINGTGDVVYIDKGRKDGLLIGDLLETTFQSEHKIITGQIQIINLKESTSTAVIRKSNNAISRGDGILQAK
ncbi:MAG: LysM peptidoglycan-binding domain-containing protein [Nitrospirota bacterium]